MQRCINALVASVLLALAFSSAAWSDTVVRVGLEPFPPLINSDGTGYTIDLLKSLEKHSNLQFQVNIMSYQRSKIELKKGNIDLIGHTPKGLESAAFYQYAQELNLKIPTRLDLFALDPRFLKPDHLEQNRLGTPPGNAAFMADLAQIPFDRFTESPLAGLVEMLTLKRIDAILFERGSVLSTLAQQSEHPTVHYKTLKTNIFAGLAVGRSPRADRLAQTLNHTLEDMDYLAFYTPYLKHYVNVAADGHTPATP